jgi:hypothetical protein
VGERDATLTHIGRSTPARAAPTAASATSGPTVAAGIGASLALNAGGARSAAGSAVSSETAGAAAKGAAVTTIATIAPDGADGDLQDFTGCHREGGRDLATLPACAASAFWSAGVGRTLAATIPSSATSGPQRFDSHGS